MRLFSGNDVRGGLTFVKLSWIECDGGAHMAIERRLIPEWSGPGHDRLYESTADIDDYAETVPFGDRRALVICENIARSCWIPASDGISVEIRDECAYRMPACDDHPGDVYQHDEIHIDPGTYALGIIPDRDYGGIGLRVFRLEKK